MEGLSRLGVGETAQRLEVMGDGHPGVVFPHHPRRGVGERFGGPESQSQLALVHETGFPRTRVSDRDGQGVDEISLAEKVVTAHGQLLDQRSVLHRHAHAAHEADVDDRGGKPEAVAVMDKRVQERVGGIVVGLAPLARHSADRGKEEKEVQAGGRGGLMEVPSALNFGPHALIPFGIRHVRQPIILDKSARARMSVDIHTLMTADICMMPATGPVACCTAASTSDKLVTLPA